MQEGVLLTGFEQPTTTASASSIASRTPGPGLATCAPAYSTRRTSGCHRARTKNSWRESRPVGVSISVRTGSSDIGAMRAVTPRASEIAWVAAESRAP